jgi:indolepyruvate ferredoxin oxidoreductase alpha subunit
VKKVLSGNEAIARGAWEAGVRLAAAYPGTPSTEILEALAAYKDIYSEWSSNEKVALEVGVGASLAGARALVCMKHVGVNVAADPLFTASYTGVKGGLVVVTADDPGMHSSQNEQDNRNYAKFAKVPLIEPADSGEAKDFLKIAFEISERFDTPVLFRTTTRIAHSSSMVEPGTRPEVPPITILEKNTDKYTMLPSNAIKRHPIVEQRLLDLAEYAETSPLNQVDMGDTRVGIIASGAAYQYAREAFPKASFLKLGLTYPLPAGLIADFRERVERLYVVEELDPFLEELIELMGIQVDGGKDLLPLCGELDPGMIARALASDDAPGVTIDLLPIPQPVADDLPNRPPTLCPGCSHRGVFTVLKKLRVFVSGDIGCYTLGALPPFEAMNSCVCMGASIGMAHGMVQVTEPQAEGAKPDLRAKSVAVIGDSTFFHSGLTPLLDIAYNGSRTLTIILDNRTTGMTGGQQNPGTGKTLMGRPAPVADIPTICRGFGLNRVVEIDPLNMAEVERVLREELAANEASVVIAKSPCALEYKIKRAPWIVDADLCNGCRRCLRAGCMALNLVKDSGAATVLSVTADAATGISAAATGTGRKVQIQADQCNGCGICAQLCRFDAIRAHEGAAPAPGGAATLTGAETSGHKTPGGKGAS